MASNPTDGRRKPAKSKGDLDGIPPARLQMVESLLARCWSHSRVAETLAKEWGLGQATIRKYIRRVYEDLRIDSEEYRATRRDRLRSAYQDLYDRSLKAENYGAARAALRDLGQLDDCFVERVEVSGVGGGAIQIDPGVAARALARKLAGLPPEAPEALSPPAPTQAPAGVAQSAITRLLRKPTQ